MPSRIIVVTLIVLGVALCRPAAVFAALTTYEGFDYEPDGSQLVGNGGVSSGFTSSWQPGGFNASVSNNYVLSTGSLSFGPLLTSGNRASSASVFAGIAGVSRTLGETLGTPGTTRYMSFLLRPEGTLQDGLFNGFFGLTLEQGFEPEMFSGKPGDGGVNYVLEDRGGSGQFVTTATAVVGETVLMVVRADFTAGLDTFTAYLNPTPGGSEPLSGTVKNDISIDFASALTIYSTGAFSIDEIRIGHTFADVTPVPEPSALGLAVAAIASLAIIWGRRRYSSRRLGSL